MNPVLPDVSADVVARSVDVLPARLRRTLDAAIGECRALAIEATDGHLRLAWGTDVVVTFTPGASGAIDLDEQVACSCLLAPRCLHRAAAIGACPVAEPGQPAPGAGDRADGLPGEPVVHAGSCAEPTAAQVRAATALREAAGAIVEMGAQAAGAVVQADLLRAAHTARLAGLYRAESAALRVVGGVRGFRDRLDAHRGADLVDSLREVLLVAELVESRRPDSALIGTARRDYESADSLRVVGMCREPVVTATGYGGVVTHVIADDGTQYTVADVKPGGVDRARGAGTASVTLTGGTLDHAALSRGGLLIVAPTISRDGRIGSSTTSRATPLASKGWTDGPIGELFAHPVAQAVRERLAGDPLRDPISAGRAARELVGLRAVVLGGRGAFLLVREISADGSGPIGPVLHLRTPNASTGLAAVANLALLASHPGLHLLVIARLDEGHDLALQALAVAPVDGSEVTLRLPASWGGHADLGYDSLVAAHLPPVTTRTLERTELFHGDVDHATASPSTQGSGGPLWRLRRLVELAVVGGRRAVAEPLRSGDLNTICASLTSHGLTRGAELVTGLVREADRQSRDAFGRRVDHEVTRYARTWLAVAAYLAAVDHDLVRSQWRDQEEGGSVEVTGRG